MSKKSYKTLLFEPESLALPGLNRTLYAKRVGPGVWPINSSRPRVMRSRVAGNAEN